MMTRNELLAALRQLKVQTGSLACLGCGYEHNCGIHGCAILREAETYIRGADIPQGYLFRFAPLRSSSAPTEGKRKMFVGAGDPARPKEGGTHEQAET